MDSDGAIKPVTGYGKLSRLSSLWSTSEEIVGRAEVEHNKRKLNGTWKVRGRTMTELNSKNGFIALPLRNNR